MKRLIAAVLGFVFVLSLGIVSALYFDKTCKETSDIVNEAISEARQGDFDAAAKAAQRAENFWEGRRKLLSFVQNHGFLYEVDTRLTGLSSLSTADAKEEFLASAEQAIQALNYVMNDK
ncbi:MAG: DUF4363 family protein [Clostridia bacterium]|nr:DUF4363 family protein [Clostridia bacterium]